MRSPALALLGLCIGSCGREPRPDSAPTPPDLALTRDTIVVNGPAPVQVAGRPFTCTERGDFRLTVSAGGASREVVVRCRPVVSFGFPPPLEMALGEPPQPVTVNALGPSGAVEPLLSFTLSVRDSTVVAIEAGLARPLAVGRTAVLVDFGGISTAVPASVFQELVADTLRLTPGEFRSWPLAPGRYEIAVMPLVPSTSLTALDLTTEGASCVPDARREDLIHCLVRERGGVGVRDQRTSAKVPPAAAFMRVRMVEQGTRAVRPR